MKKRVSVRQRIFSRVLGIGTVIFVLFLAAVYYLSTTALEATIGEDFQRLAHQMSDKISLALQKEIDQWTVFTQQSELIRAVERANSRYQGLDDKRLRKEFARIDREWPYSEKHRYLYTPEKNPTVRLLERYQAFHRKGYVELFVTDARGALVAGTNRTTDYWQADEGWWQEAFNDGRGAVFVSDVEFDESAQMYAVSIALPVMDLQGAGAVGVMKVVLCFHELLKEFDEYRLGRTGHVKILGSSGSDLFELTGMPGRYPNVLKEGVIDELRGSAAGYLVAANQWGRRFIIGFAPVFTDHRLNEGAFGGKQWYVLMSQELAEAYAPIYRLMTVLFALGLLVPTAIYMTASVTAKTITTPLAELHRGTRLVSQGDLDYRVSLGTEDELEDLARSFNEMTARLQAYYKELDERVAQRTQELNEARQYMENLIEISADAIISANAEGEIAVFNKGAEAMFGYRREEIIGGHVTELYGSPEEAKEVMRRMREGEGAVAGFETSLKAKDGRMIPVLISASILCDAEGREVGTVGFNKDLRKRKEAEDALRGSEERYRSLAETSTVGIWHITPEGETIYLNPAMSKMLEIDGPEELEGKTHHAFFTPESVEIMEGEFAKRRAGLSSNYEVDLISRSGRRRNVLISGSPILSAEGKLRSLSGIFLDITERKKAEKELRAGKRFLSDVFESIQDGISVLDVDYTILSVNPTMERWYAHAAPLVGKKCYEVYHGRSYACEKCPTRRALDEGESSHDVVPKIGPSGEVVGWLDLYSFPLVDTATGRLKGVIEYVRDVTDKMRAQEAIQETKAFYEQLVGDAGDAVVALDVESKIITWNLGAEKIFGYEAHDVVGSHGSLLVPEGELERARELRREVLAGQTVRDEAVRRTRKDGVVIDGLATFSPLRSPEGEVVGFCTIFKDITERKKAEVELQGAHEELKRAYDALERAQVSALTTEKLAALGRLTAGVTHEILNPLNIITLRLHLMMNDPHTPEPVMEKLHILDEQANRIIKITQDLLSFARQRPPERREVDINDVVRRTLGLIEYELPKDNIALDLKLAEELPEVFADPNQLQQVLLNLITNSRDAMPDGGSLLLATGVVRQNGKKFLELTVSDTGKGITSEHLDKLFEPFFTTKPEGDGTGLGLSICQGMVEAHGGSIRAETEVGLGTTFVVKLPL